METQQLVTLAEIYAAHRGISHWRVAVLAGQGGGFFHRLKGGASCTIKTDGFQLP